MSTTYDSTIKVLQSLLTTLSHLLHKSTQTSLPEQTILDARLHESMYALPDQIRLATQFSAYLVARLTASEPIIFEGNPSSLSECQERIQTVLSALDSAERDTVNEQAEVVKSTPAGPGVNIDITGAVYAHTIVLPNVYFHVATAYGILRSKGVEIGKRDWYQGFFPQ
ncbi:hypothetical protein BDV18DRAFT_132623 [Aspergillus unguis]